MNDIAPSDAAVAARSFPRRWRALHAIAAGDDDHPDVWSRSGAAGLCAEAATVLADTASRLPAGVPGSPVSIESNALDRLEAEAVRLATVIDSVAADDWAGAPIHALTEGIDRAAALLRRADNAVREARVA